MKSIKSLVRGALGERAYAGLSRRKGNARAMWDYLLTRYVRRAPYLGYDRDYYAESDRQYGHSFAVMAQAVVERYRPARVADIGCGSGAFGAALMKCGVCEVYGFDQSADAVALARGNGLTDAAVLDVTAAERMPVTADLCTSFEVAEHLPGRYARRFCELLAAAAPAVVITAATPGQGGHLHVNEQEPDYWIGHMRACGMACDAESAATLKAALHGRVAAHYHDNLLAFRRA